MMITLLLVLHRMYSVKTEYTYTTSVAEPEVEMSQQTNANSSSSQCSQSFYWTPKSIRLHSQKLMEVQWQENGQYLDHFSFMLDECLLSVDLTPLNAVLFFFHCCNCWGDDYEEEIDSTQAEVTTTPKGVA